ncbi:hypothetical protein GCM10027426_01260 [Microbacterium lacusdiani]
MDDLDEVERELRALPLIHRLELLFDICREHRVECHAATVRTMRAAMRGVARRTTRRYRGDRCGVWHAGNKWAIPFPKTPHPLPTSGHNMPGNDEFNRGLVERFEAQIPEL